MRMGVCELVRRHDEGGEGEGGAMCVGGCVGCM